MRRRLERPAPDPALETREGPLAKRETHVERAASHDGDVVIKSATARGRSRVRREAELLARLRLPGLVEISELREDDERTVMVTADAGRRTLARPADLTGDELLRSLRRSASTLAELHRSGWSHGAIAPEHVIVGPRGRARLCSLGRATPVDDDSARRDVAQLLRLVEHVASLTPLHGSRAARRTWRRRSARLRRIASEASQMIADPAGSAVPADGQLRALIDDLSMVDAPRHLRIRDTRTSRRTTARRRSTSSSPTGGRAAWPSARRLRLLAGVGVLCGGAAIATSAAASRADPPAAAANDALVAPAAVAALPPARCPTWPTGARHVDIDGDGCGEEVRIESNLLVVDDVTYRVGIAGDDIELADWDCDGRVTVLLLRPATGELFDFPVWADERAPSEGHLLSTSSGAAALSTSPASDAGGGSCDAVTVALDDGTEIDPLPSGRRNRP